MGLTIFYSGQLRNVSQMPDLIEEVTDICRSHDWKVDFHFRTNEIPVSGISFMPKGGQPIWLTFLQDGTLINADLYIIKDQVRFPRRFRKAFPILNTTTQFAGIDAHMAIVRLMRYLKEKYFDRFHFIDESKYWETNDEDVCRRHFKMFEEWMDEMARELSKLDGRIHDGGETVQERIDILLQKGLSMEEIIDAFDEFEEFSVELARKYKYQ
jgi:hypothetical protein